MWLILTSVKVIENKDQSNLNFFCENAVVKNIEILELLEETVDEKL